MVDSRKLQFFFIVFLLVFAPVQAVYAAASVSPQNTDETVANQAMSANQNLLAFSGSITNSGDSDATLDTFTFVFNDDDASLDTPEDNIDALTVEITASGMTVFDTNIDVDDSTTGPFTYRIGPIGAGLASDGGSVEYSVSLKALDNPTHDDQFDLTFKSIDYTESGSGDTPTINDIGQTNVITIKTLIESYAEVEDLPRILASESDKIPLVHMEFAGQNSSSDPSQRFSQVEFRIRELLGDVIPGGDKTYGDFSSVSLIRSSQEEFGDGTETTLFSLDRDDLDLPISPADSYVIDFDNDGDFPPSSDDEELFFDETTDESHYYITISTNQGWGTAPREADNAQWFGFGDAWDAWIDTGAIAIDDINTVETVDNEDMGDTTVDVTQGPIYNSFLGFLAKPLFSSLAKDVGPFSTSTADTPELIDKYFGDPTQLQNDNIGLDYHPDQLFFFVILGPADGGDEQTRLKRITLEFPDRTGPFDPCEDLRPLTNNRESGLSIWKNTSQPKSVGQEDTLLELSTEGSSVCKEGTNQAVLELQNGEPLPSPSDITENPDPDMTVGRGVGGEDDANPSFFVSALMDKTVTAPDSFVASVQLGGVSFADGTSVADGDTRGTINESNNMQALPDTIPIHTDTGAFQANPVRTFFEQTTQDSAQVGAPSERTVVMGLNTLAPDTSAKWDLTQVDVQFEDGGDAFTADDLKELTNDSSKQSGVAIYQDDNSDSLNKKGVFQPEIDDRLDLDLSSSRKDLTEGEGKTAPIIRLVINDDARIPHTNSGDSEGSDFFVVVSTSERADNADQFRPSLGNAVINDGVVPKLGFTREAFPDTKTEIFISGDPSATNRFFGDLVNINTITFLGLNSITGSDPSIGVAGEHLGVLGLNISDSEPGQTLDRVRTTVNFVTNTDTSDFRDLTNNRKSGIALWKDNGDGVFNRDEDELVKIRNPKWTTFPSDDTAAVDLIPDTELEIPDKNDSVDDFFISLRASDEMELGDEFSASIRGGDIQFSVENSPEDKAETTPVIEAGLPVLINDRTDKPRQTLRERGERIDALGINIADNDEGEEFEEVTVNLKPVNNFSCSRDLSDLSADTSSGVSIWGDASGEGRGAFDPEQDIFLAPDTVPTCGGGTLNFDFGSSDIPITNELDNRDEFFVVVRTSEDIGHGSEFKVAIPNKGVKTTFFESRDGKTSRSLVFGSVNRKTVTITDTNLINNHLDVTVQVDQQDTVALRLATDDQVNDSPLGYDKVDVQRATEDGGSVYQFDDINVTIAADTIGILARAFNDTGFTDFSDKDIFSRDSLVGIDLTGDDRPVASDLSTADAMAADEDFGIAVFGNKGGSNNNSDDPVFNPDRGETLKIIPPVDSTVTVEIYNIEQERVFKTSTGVAGAPAEWDGSGEHVSTVNNGVYIVRVKSGGEVKSFPVVVLK